jgi:hypothetical protein
MSWSDPDATKIKEIQNKADVHYSAAGYTYPAEKVAAEIEAARAK